MPVTRPLFSNYSILDSTSSIFPMNFSTVLFSAEDNHRDTEGTEKTQHKQSF